MYVGHGTKVLEPTVNHESTNALEELRDLVNNEKSMFAWGLSGTNSSGVGGGPQHEQSN